MTDEELKEKVIRHDYEFKSLTSSLEDLSGSMKKLALGLEKILVLDERLINIDKDLKESFKRVHCRQDDMEKDLDEFKSDMEVVRILSKHPYLLGAMALGFIALNTEPIRKIIIGM